MWVTILFRSCWKFRPIEVFIIIFLLHPSPPTDSCMCMAPAYPIGPPYPAGIVLLYLSGGLVPSAQSAF